MLAAANRESYRPALVPIVLSLALIGAVTLAALIAPQAWRGPATLATATAVLLLSYLRWPKAALLVFAMFILFYNTFARWLTPSLEQLDEVVVPGLVVISAWRLRPWQKGLIEPVRDGAVVALMLLAVASSVVNGVPLNLWLIGLLLLAKVIGFLYVVMWHDFTLDDVRAFAPLVLSVGALVLALGAVEMIDPPAFQKLLNLTEISVPRGQLPSIKSLFYHPVLFSWFTAFIALFLFAYYIVFRRWWLLIAAAAFGLGTLLAARRRTIVGAAIGLGVGLLNQLRHARSRGGEARSWLPVVASLLVLVVLFLPGLIGLYQLTLRETGPPGQLPEGADQQARILMYTTSAEIARDYFPLGAGLGRFGSTGSRLEYSPIYVQYGLDQVFGLRPSDAQFITDTFWPRILGETGVFGLAAYFVFAGAILVALWRICGMATTRDPYLRAFTLGTLMIFGETLVETLASSMFNSPPRIYLIFGAVGMCLAFRRRYLAPEVKAETAPESAS